MLQNGRKYTSASDQHQTSHRRLISGGCRPHLLCPKNKPEMNKSFFQSLYDCSCICLMINLTFQEDRLIHVVPVFILCEQNPCVLCLCCIKHSRTQTWTSEALKWRNLRLLGLRVFVWYSVFNSSFKYALFIPSEVKMFSGSQEWNKNRSPLCEC